MADSSSVEPVISLTRDGGEPFEMLLSQVTPAAIGRIFSVS